MPLYRFDGHAPQVPASAWVAAEATLVGRVELGERASVWFGAVIRGDNELIRIGEESNVQDGAVLHADPGFVLSVGRRVTIGHQAMLHGCTVGDGSLIGIQSVVLNGAVIGRNCLVGAGTIVTEGKRFPEGMLILGAPAKAVRPLTEAEVQRLAHSAAGYVKQGARFRNEIERVA
jgi:carbonic anhydrase/acetyltransferase-like protein (isoleucine patch superfamily)